MDIRYGCHPLYRWLSQKSPSVRWSTILPTKWFQQCIWKIEGNRGYILYSQDNPNQCSLGNPPGVEFIGKSSWGLKFCVEELKKKTPRSPHWEVPLCQMLCLRSPAYILGNCVRTGFHLINIKCWLFSGKTFLLNKFHFVFKNIKMPVDITAPHISQIWCPFPHWKILIGRVISTTHT